MTDRSFFGHPRGLSTLFFTEMWERFSFYGMKAMLFLFITAAIIEGPQSGLGIGEETGGAIAGLYNSFVYLLALPGGWLADRLIGQRKAVMWGGIIIACGHYSMAATTVSIGFFYLGLILIVTGTGLLKPNISTMVGELYEGDMGARRDAGFSIFYMGINIGAFLAPIACGQVREWFGWHFGFGLAGVGMTFGVLWYILDGKSLGTAGLEPKSDPSEIPKARRMAIGAGVGVVGFIVLMTALHMSGVVTLTWTGVADVVGGATLVVVGLYLAMVAVEVVPSESRAGARKMVGTATVIVMAAVAVASLALNDGGFSVSRLLLWETYGLWGLFALLGFWLGLTKGESWGATKKVAVIGILFVFTALFWSGFEQASTSLNAFARDYTDRVIFASVSFLPDSVRLWEIPVEWLQSVNPLFIIALAPVFGAMWIRLASKNMNPNIPLKFALGLIQLGLGFFVIMFAARLAGGGAVDPGYTGAQDLVMPTWLCMMYLLFTTGELCLSPIGLSTITKLAPEKFVSQMMGIWFIAAALGNLIAGRVGGMIEHQPDASIFMIVALITGGGGLLMLLISPFIQRRMMGDVK
jgi:POT family proton-dependent oligopeptide transporter